MGGRIRNSRMGAERCQQEGPCQEAAKAAQEGEKRQNAQLERIRSAAAKEVQAASYPLNLVLTETPGKLNDEQKQALKSAQAALQRLSRAADKTVPAGSSQTEK